MMTTPIGLPCFTTDQSSMQLRLLRQVSQGFKTSIEEVTRFGTSSTLSTNEDLTVKASNLGQDIDKTLTIFRELDKTGSASNNNDMERDDNTTEIMTETATSVCHAFNELGDNLKTLIADEVIDQTPFGEPEQLFQPSTGKQYETSLPVIEGNEPFLSLKQMASSERFDEIISNFKKSIKKAHCPLNELERDELITMIMHLRSDLFAIDPSIPPSYDITNGDVETQKDENRDKIIQCLVQQSDSHDKLLKQVIADMQPPTPVVQSIQQNSPVAGQTVEVVLGVMLSWTLITLIQNQ